MRIQLENTVGLLIDVQDRLLPHMHDSDSLLDRLSVLIQGLTEMSVPLILSEQYKKGLGETSADLRNLFQPIISIEKTSFSCVGNHAFDQWLVDHKVSNVLLFGIETHVCVLQTAVDLKEKGLNPVVIWDGVSSRSTDDKDIALQRLMVENIRVASVESILFELCKTAKNPVFKAVSKLVK